MVEPPETESKEALDYFIKVMQHLAEEAESQPEIFLDSPRNMPVCRLDEVKAARELDLRWQA